MLSCIVHFSARNSITFAFDCFLRCSKCVIVQLYAVTPYSVDKIRKSILYTIKYIYQPPIFMAPFIRSRRILKHSGSSEVKKGMKGTKKNNNTARLSQPL